MQVQQDIIKDFLQEKLAREQRAKELDLYFQDRTPFGPAPRLNPEVAEQMHQLSEDVRELTLSFQEDATFIEGGMSQMLRSLDQLLKTVQ